MADALFAAPDPNVKWVFLELGLAVLGLALLVRLAHWIGVSAVPLFLLGGLAYGNGGLLPLSVSEEFVQIGAEIGVVLLLFMLGLEYSGEQLVENLRTGLPGGVADFVLNFPPGVVAGLLLGWGPLAAALLGGVTYISSSGIVARVLGELGQLKAPETPTVLSVLVLEDLAMTVYLPVVSVLLVGRTAGAAAAAVAGALVAVGCVLLVAVRYGGVVSRVVSHASNEAVMLTVLGLILAVAGAAERLQVSAAVGAFLVGVAVSGPLVKQTHRQIAPLRDLFAGLFFLFFGLQIDATTLPPVLPPAAGLAVVTGAAKVATGWWAARRAGTGSAAGLRAGVALIARGEFSLVIAGLGAGLEPQLGPLAAAYVLMTAVAGPVAARLLRRRTPAADRGEPAADGRV